MIHVAYRLWGGDGFYAKLLTVSMISMFENTKEKVTVHVMHNDRLTEDNCNKFCYIAEKYDQQIEFHNVEEISGATLRKFEEIHPIDSGINASWYPFILHEVFPNLDKIIFMGTDTVINLDIAELWAHNLDEFGLAAVPEILSENPMKFFVLCQNNLVKREDYCNADVLLVNPKFFLDHSEEILKGLKFIADNRTRYGFCEQDVLNYLFSEKILKLPKKFNVILNQMRIHAPNSEIGREIYHFAGGKPDLNTDDGYNRLYFEYFKKTPYATVDMFGNIHKACEKIFNRNYNESKNNLLHFTNLLTERKRAFFVDKNNLNAIRQIFAIKDDELIVDASNPMSLGDLLLAMKESQGKKIFFILFDNYFSMRIALLQRGFIEGTDFVNILSFLSEQYGVKVNFNSQYIVQAM